MILPEVVLFIDLKKKIDLKGKDKRESFFFLFLLFFVFCFWFCNFIVSDIGTFVLCNVNVEKKCCVVWQFELYYVI